MTVRPTAESELPTGTVTFLRTDVEGSMALARTLGARWDNVNETHLGLIRAAIDAHGGVCVRTEGDAVFGVFPEAGAAATAAIDAQRTLADHHWPTDAQVRVRMGLHTGEAHLAGDDYGGFEVNRAARIAAVGHGGQIVLSDPTRALIAARLPSGVAIHDLGRHALKDVPEAEHLFQLDVPGLRTGFPPLRTSSATAGDLPIRMTSLIGRTGDVDQLVRMLDASRMVTLTGPGGIGKTSLAIEVARTGAGAFPDGAWFVALDQIGDPEQVAPTIARTLGLFDGPERSAADGLAGFLADRSVLLVLDNFEHVLNAAGEVAAILRASPGTRVLATSRAPLHIAGEQEYPLRPLGPLPAESQDAVPGADDDPAVRLFIERARSVRPNWEPGDEVATVRQICDLVDGLPLGIELAAARVSLLPLSAIRDRLAGHRPLPGAVQRDVPDRQRTLQDTISWSYDLLSPELRRVLRGLAVFDGGFRLEEARLVDDTGDDDILDRLLALAEQSLISPDLRADAVLAGSHDGTVRFRLLETIRTFALGELRAEGREDEVRRRHAEAYLRLAEAAAPHMPSLDQAPWLDRLALDQANLRAAVSWAVEAGEVEVALRLVAALWRFWQLDGHLAEGQALAEAALAMPGADVPTAWRLGAVTAAGGIAYWQARRDDAIRFYREERDLATALGDDAAAADGWFNLLSSQFMADPQASLEASVEVRDRFERLGDERGMARVDWGRASILLRQGRHDEAMPMFASLLDQFERLGDAMYQAMAMGSFAWVEFARGDIEAARPWAIRSLVMLHALRDYASTTITLQEGVTMAVVSGRFEDGAILSGAFEGLSERFGVRPPIPLQEIINTTHPGERLAANLEPERLAALTERGRRMSLDEAVAYVVRMADDLEAADKAAASSVDAQSTAAAQ